MTHVSVCVEISGKRCAFVVSASTDGKAVAFAETFRNRVGYVASKDFGVAVRRCTLMEIDSPGAWGSPSLWTTEERGSE